MEVIRFDEMKKTWYQIARDHDGNIPASFELEVYKKMLHLFHVGDFYYYIVNIAQVEMEYVSDQVEPILGVPKELFTVKYIFDNIHPDDKERFAAHEQRVTEFFNALPPEKILKYKVSYDYRLRCANGSYKWILMQTVTVQSDENGSVIRVLGVQTDITHLKTDNKGSGLSFLGMDGEPSFYNVDITNTGKIKPTTNDLFSRREKEVLRMILSGKSTKDVASLLNISIHTINSHRKNIYAKSRCTSLVELGAKSVQEGWL